MSETAEAPKKKKKPIMPIAAVVLLLAGGGYFMMKGGKDAKAKPAITMGEKESELEEFLTNTANPSVYVRAKVAVRLKKGYEETKLKDNMGDVRDAVLMVLNSMMPNDITDPAKRPFFKKRLAAAMNKVLGAEEEAAQAKDKKTSKPDKDGDADSADWDSKTGPVLKVRFSAIATQ